MIPLDTKPKTPVWWFSPRVADRGVVAIVVGFRAPAIEPYGQILSMSHGPVYVEDCYLTEAEATSAYAAWLFKRGEQIAAELHENEKKFWVAKQRVHELKEGAKEREVR